MSLPIWTIIILSHIISITFAWWALTRLFLYINAYRFDESQYTLLLGFIHMRWIAGLYIVTTIAFGIFAVIYPFFVL